MQTSYKYAWFCGGTLTLCWFITTMYLPAISHLEAALHTTPFMIKTIISLYFIFFFIGQVVWGPISDKYARNKVLLIALLLAWIGTLLCSIATNAGVFLIGRSLQGLGIGAVPALSRSMVNDLYPKNVVIKVLIYLSSIVAIASAIAPVIGAQLLNLISWRSIFIFQLLFGLILIVINGIAIKQFYPHVNNRHSNHPLLNYFHVIQNKKVIFYLMIYILISGSLIAFYSASPFILMTTLKMSADDYGLLLLSAGIFYIVAIIAVRILLIKLTIKNLLIIGVSICLTAGILFLILSLFFKMVIWTVVVPIFIFFFGGAFIPPITNTKAMHAIPELAGTVASLMGAGLALSSGILSYILLALPISHLLTLAIYFTVIPLFVSVYLCLHYWREVTDA
jgi:MFS transporter, DHA1 family, multidrug resistance protein